MQKVWYNLSVDTSYGTGSLLRITCKNVEGKIMGCRAANSRSISRVFVNVNPKFDLEKFRDLVIAIILTHDFPFRFIEYEGLREIFQYIYEDLKLLSRNTARANVLKLY